ncbi:MAG: hypothetical protein JW941_13020 [Candidatus Coatesbacteria bacterium]|nr:hypothetical protein [Candidatus Coatesbacteria bacterium]
MKKTFRPDIAMVKSLESVTGSRFAEWYRIGISRRTEQATALLPLEASKNHRDRLFFVNRDMAVEIILGCPKCKREIHKIGEARCSNCGHWIRPDDKKTPKLRHLMWWSVLIGVGSIIFFLPGIRDLENMSPISVVVTLLGVAIGFASLLARHVKILYRFGDQKSFRDCWMLKLDPEAYSPKRAISSVGTSLSVLARRHIRDRIRNRERCDVRARMRDESGSFSIDQRLGKSES